MKCFARGSMAEPLSPEKYLEYVRRMNRICDSVTSERDALHLIKTICEEKSPGSEDGHSTPLDFVWQVANTVLTNGER